MPYIVALTVAAAFAGACDSHSPVAPNVKAELSPKHPDTTLITEPSTPAKGTPSDTAPHSTPPVTPPPADSGITQYSGTVAVTGHALLVRYAAPGSSGDSVVYQAVPGTTVTAVANATGRTIATTTTGADGGFSMSVPSGVYRISGHAPTGSGASDVTVLVNADIPSITVQLFLPPSP
jgi:hypothetical protein